MSSPEAPAPTRPSRFGRFFWRDPNTQFLLLAAAVGIAGALGAVGFRALSVWLTHLIFDAEDIVAGAESLPPILRIFIPAAGGFLGGLIVRLFAAGGGSQGISHMIEVVHLGRRAVRLRPSIGRRPPRSQSSPPAAPRVGRIDHPAGAAFSSGLSRCEGLARAGAHPRGVRNGGGGRGRLQHSDRRDPLRPRGRVGSFSMTLFARRVVSP